MNYLGRMVSSWKDFYNDLNAANLTGAIDIMVIKQRDGTLKCSPFYVRFGKMGVLRPGDLQKKIEITVNGKLTPLCMKLDESGSAFFVEPVQPEENPTHNVEDLVAAVDSSPVKQPEEEEKKLRQLEGKTVARSLFSDESSESMVSVRSEENISNKGSPMKKTTVTYGVPSSEPFEARADEMDPSVIDDNVLSSSLPAVLRDSTDVTVSVDNIDWEKPSSRSHSISENYHPFSDGEVDNSKLTISRMDSPVPYSDTELELNWNRSTGDTTVNDPTTPDSTNEANRQKQATNDSQARDWFFIRMMRYLRSSRSRRIPSLEEGIYLDELDDKKPETVSMYLSQQSNRLSLDDLDMGQESSGFGSTPLHSPTGTNPEQSKGIFNQEVDNMMSIIDGAALSLCGRLKEHDNHIPEDLFVQYQVSFQDFCNNPALFNNPNLVVRLAGKYYSWQVAAPMLMSILIFQQPLPPSVQEKLVKNVMPKKGGTRFSWFSGWGRSQGSGSMDKQDELRSSGGPTLQRDFTQSMSSDDEDIEKLPRRQRSLKRKKYHKLRHLTSDQLKSLELKDGMNEMRFSITTKFQGTCVAECTLYLWDYTEKIIVSDIDGTITRSDVAGHLLPLFGKDWSHAGVAGLFTTIHKNGYKFIYLSARAIGMSKMTKGFLNSIIQDNMSLPSGPLLLSPFSVLKALHKEVIERKPEEFKIACLKEIRSLFPEDCNPFYAGFGNKHTDAISYQTVDIPVHRIFTINHKGCLKHMLSLAFQSSYNSLSIMCDHIFPPFTKSDEEKCQEEFSDCNYWKQTVTRVEDLPDLA